MVGSDGLNDPPSTISAIHCQYARQLQEDSKWHHKLCRIGSSQWGGIKMATRDRLHMSETGYIGACGSPFSLLNSFLKSLPSRNHGKIRCAIDNALCDDGLGPSQYTWEPKKYCKHFPRDPENRPSQDPHRFGVCSVLPKNEF